MEFNLYLWEIVFEFDVVALTIETIKLVVFKPLDIFWRFWNTRKWTSAKKVKSVAR